MKKIFYILFIITIVISCKNEEIYNTKSSVFRTNYYPVEEGKILFYDVTEINIDADVDVFDTIKYKLKEEFELQYTDDERNTNYRINRYYKTRQDTVWKILNVWYVSLTNNSVETTEDNYRYKRLLLPLKIGNKWNGNIYNTKSEEIYELTKLNEPETINNFNFSKVCVVLQNDYENLIEKYYSVEKYTENIGLVYRENIEISEMTPMYGVPYQERIKVGKIYIQIIENLTIY